jgi:hypothetical protein
VVAQVVYDELAMLDDLEGVDIQRINRELKAKDPLALNLMRITVDGVPLDDPGRSLADIQRCTDVALEDTSIQFRFDDLESKPRLSVVASPIAVPSNGAGGEAAPAVRFRTYTNYAHWIERTEVRVFEREQSVDGEPVAVLEVAPDGDAAWRPEAEHFASPNREMKYVLRAYGADGRWDETSPQTLWIVHGDPSSPGWLDSLEPEPVGDRLDAGYGEIPWRPSRRPR